MFDLLLRKPKSLNIFTIRHIADFEWARYNFWCNAKIMDSNCDHASHWTIVGKHFRSPDDFHQKIIDEVGGGHLPHETSVRDYFTRTIKSTDMHITVLASEMLQYDITKFWTLLANESTENIGMALTWHPHLEKLQKTIINSNNNKGSDSISNLSGVKTGLYKISGYKPMLATTKNLITTWWKECEELKRITLWSGYNCNKPIPANGKISGGVTIRNQLKDNVTNVSKETIDLNDATSAIGRKTSPSPHCRLIFQGVSHSRHLDIFLPKQDRFPAYTCHEEFLRWQKRVSSNETVLKAYDGPWAISDIQEDGSWDVTDIDGTVFRVKSVPIKPTHSCFEVSTDVRKENSGTFKFCYPLFNIVGNEKCGTSALYNLLSKHPQMTEANSKTKEYCYGNISILNYLKGFKKAAIQNDLLLINGCIDLRANSMFDLLLRQPKSVYLFMVRDIAELEWAKYNFWCNGFLDSDCDMKGFHWTILGKHSRSPKDFHQKILQKFEGGALIPHQNSVQNYFTSKINSTDINLTVLSSEMLKHKIEKFWSMLTFETKKQAMVTLRWHPHLEELKTKVINSSNQKGPKFIVNASDVKQGLYEISGYDPLWNETRELLVSWWDECEEIRRLTSWNKYKCSEN